MKKVLAILIVLAMLLVVSSALGEETIEETTDEVMDDVHEVAEIPSWDCPKCGTAGNTGKFCPECGSPMPWVCPNCGADGNTGKFCPNCGSAKPDGVGPTVEPKVKVGDIVTFGKYEQDNNKSNGAEPIEWIVLDTDGNYALLLSRFGLIKAPYARSSNGQTWANAEIRGTLNTDFYKAAFTDDEKAAILAKHVDESVDQQDPDHPADEGRVGNNTTDRIYILSYAEIIQYMPTEEDRKCYVTEYIKKNANYSDKQYAEGYTCWYWLRNPAYSNNAGVVDWDGSIDACIMQHPYGVIRPCCWVKIDALQK